MLVGHPVAVAEGRGRYREGGDAPRVFGDILHCSRPGRLGAGPCGRRPTRLCTDKLPICTQIGGASLGAAAPPPSRAGLWPSARRQASFPALSPSFQALQALCQASQAPPMWQKYCATFLAAMGRMEQGPSRGGKPGEAGEFGKTSFRAILTFSRTAQGRAGQGTRCAVLCWRPVRLARFKSTAPTARGTARLPARQQLRALRNRINSLVKRAVFICHITLPGPATGPPARLCSFWINKTNQL